MQALDPTLEIVTFLPEDDEDMALGSATKQAITDEVERQLGLAVDQFNPRGWRKFLHFAREWGIVGTIGTVIVGLLALAAAAFYQATARVAKEAIFETNTTRDLTDIQKDIKAIRGDLAKQVVVNHASSPLSDFKTTLPDLSSAIATLREQGLTVAPSVINDLQHRLISVDASAPDYWPTVLQFLQFASSGLSSAKVPLPGSKPQLVTHNSSVFMLRNHFESMTVELDGGILDGDVFENCRIIFTETPVQMHNVTFIDSVFEFPVSATPPAYIQKASKVLLASDLKTVTFSGI